MENSKLLIVDDDVRNIFALQAVLKSKGYHCLTVTGMKEAFQVLDANQDIKVILLDMMMPDMDGYEALGILKVHEQYRHIRVVAVTAQAMKGDRERCLDAGADGYVSKPVDIDELMLYLS